MTRDVVRPELYCGAIRGNAASDQAPRITVLFTSRGHPPKDFEYLMTAVELNLYCT